MDGFEGEELPGFTTYQFSNVNCPARTFENNNGSTHTLRSISQKKRYRDIEML